MFRRFGMMVWMAEGVAEGGAPAAAPATDAAPAAAAPVAALESTLLTPPPVADPPVTDPPAAEPPKTEEPPKVEDPVPLDPKDYKVSLPEGITSDDELLQSFLTGAAKGGFDNESVQAVLDELAPKMADRLAEPVRQWNTLNQTWQAEVKAQPDIGGAKLDATVATVQQAIDLVSVGYTDHNGKQVSAAEQALAVRQALTMTGAGNNPALFRFFHDLAKSHVEAGPVTGLNPVVSGRSAASIMYDKTGAAG